MSTTILTQEFINSYKLKDEPFKNHGLGEFVYVRTYSRIKENGENERWFETIERVINGVYLIKKLHYQENNILWNEQNERQEAEKMYNLMFNISFLSGGRSLWAMGSAVTNIKGIYAALNNCALTTTNDINKTFSEPFRFLADACMLGVGVGYDTEGAGKLTINQPREPKKIIILEDSREGWITGIGEFIDQYLKPDQNIVELDYSLIRPPGVILKTFGGISSGADPLINAINKSKEILDKNINKQISSRIIVDLMNLICLCVVSGNVRRSASIAIGNQDDDEFMNLKDYLKYPERIEYGWLSNNSIKANIGTDYTKIGNSVQNIGEPGVLWLDNMQKYSRMNGVIDWKDKNASGSNPCVVAGTYVLTERGNVLIEQHIGETLNVWNGYKFTPAEFKITGHNIKIYKITLSNYNTLVCTGSHNFINKDKSQISLNEIIKIRETTSNYHLYNYSFDNCICIDNEKSEYLACAYNDGTLANITNFVPNSNYSINSRINWIAGLIDTCGKRVTLCVEIAHSNYEFIFKVKLLLLTFGINCKIRINFNNSYYGIFLNMSNIINLIEKGLKCKTNILEYISAYSQSELQKQHREIANISDTHIGITNIEYVGIAETVYCVTTLDESHTATFNGIVTGNCGEITLEPYELCNLVEVFINRHETYEQFQETLKYAFIYAKIVSTCNTQWDKTNKIISKNRRIGCSLTGIVNFIEDKGIDKLREWTTRGYEYMKNYDIELSKIFKINTSIKITCVKPSGTISLLVPNTCPGIHYPINRYYIRRVRINENSTKLIQSMKERGYTIEDSVNEPHTKIINFIIDNKCSRSIDDVSMWEQLELASKLQEWWADNQVSCTVSFDKKNEGKDIKNALSLYQYRLKGISFLPKMDKNVIYPQMPYEKITQEQYNELSKSLNTSTCINKHIEIDVNAQEQDVYCTSDSCELKSYKKYTMKHVIFINGITGSGKSYIAKKINDYLKNQNINSIILSKDTYRYDVDRGYIFEEENEKMVVKKYFEELNRCLNNNKYKYIILDNTHLNYAFINQSLKFISDYNTDYIILGIYPNNNPEWYINHLTHKISVDNMKKQIEDWFKTNNLVYNKILLKCKENDKYFDIDEINKIIVECIDKFK